jgi:ABC-2 type transport system permease protein
VEGAVSAIYILWLRELKRYSRSRAQVLASLGQPLLYLLVLGFGLGPVFQKAGKGSYLWDRQFGFLKETLVAPVPRLHIMVGRTLGGASVAMIQGLLILVVCVIAGFRPWSVVQLPLGIAVMALVAIVFAALGTAIGSTLQNMQGFQLVMNFLVMPIFFLSGALFPLDGLPAALSVVTKLDPLTYGIDGLRGTLIGLTHFGLATDVGVLSVVAAAFLVLGAYSFSRIQI